MLTKNAIGNLKNRYKAVLKKCNLLNTFGSLALVGTITASLSFGANMLMPENANALSQYFGEDYAIIDTTKNPDLKDENYLTTFEVDNVKYGLFLRNPYDNNYLIGSVDSLAMSYEGYFDGAGTWEMTTQNSSTPSTGSSSSPSGTVDDFYPLSSSASGANIVATPSTGTLVNTVPPPNSGRITNPSGDITGSFVGLSLDGDGGAIHNPRNNTINSISASFIGNSANYGGAVANYGTIHTLNGIFIGNNANRNGGAIWSGNIGTLNGVFIGNSANNGGAIASSNIGTLNGVFIGNSANNDGGAINYTEIDTLYASFLGNSAINGKGGAISNGKTINLITGNGLNLFAGNTDKTGSNAIHNVGTFNINTGSLTPNSMGYVHIKDNISGVILNNAPFGTFTINGDLTTHTNEPTNGFVMMDGIITDNNLYLQGGSLFFTDGTVQEHFDGGTNSTFNTASGSVLYLDVDDEITASGGVIKGTLAYNILDATQTHFSPKIDSNIDTKATTFARAYTQAAEYEYLGNSFAIGGSDGLSSAIANSNVGTGRVSTYSITSSSDYVVPINQNLDRGTLTIFGNHTETNNYSLEADNVSTVVNVGTNATLNILDAEIYRTGQNGASGTAIINSGTTNIFNSQIVQNKNYAIDAKDGVVNIYNSTFHSNDTAINIANSAVVNVYASYGETSIDGNNTNGIANAGTLNLRAQGGTIILGDTITGDGAININDTYHSGTIALNEDMSSYTGDVNFNNGTITVDGNLSPTNTTDYTPFFNNFNVHGGTIDAINEKMDRFNMANWNTANNILFNSYAPLNARIDVDLANKTADFFDKSANQRVNITAIDLIDTYLDDGNTKNIDFKNIKDVSVQVANGGNNFTLETLRAYSPTYMYDVSSADLQSDGTIFFGNRRDNPMTKAANVTATLTTNINLDTTSSALDNMMGTPSQDSPPPQSPEITVEDPYFDNLLNALNKINPNDLNIDYEAVEAAANAVAAAAAANAADTATTLFAKVIDFIKAVQDYEDAGGTIDLRPHITAMLKAMGITVNDNGEILIILKEPKIPGFTLIPGNFATTSSSESSTAIAIPITNNGESENLKLPQDITNIENFGSGTNLGSAPTILEQALYANSMQNRWTAWAQPNATFESTDAENYTIDTESYGIVAGFNSPTYGQGDLKIKYSAYLGYNNTQSEYSTVETEQSGGTIGLGASIFYGNFTFGATVNATLTNNEITNNDPANTFYTSDEYDSTTLGFGVNAAYNFSFKEGKYNLRPSLGVSYSHVNTEDYTNSAGLHTKPEDSSTWQISPALTFVANFDNDFSLTASAKYNFLIKEDNITYVGGVPLPSSDVDDYTTLSLGVSKEWDNFTLYGKINGNMGGRETIGFNAGIEYKF